MLISSKHSLAVTNDCPEWEVAVATTPAPPQAQRSYLLFKKHLLDLQEEVFSAIGGDSIAEGFPADFLQSRSPGKKVVNLGVAGDRTQDFNWHVDNTKPKAQLGELILILGANDVSRYSACAAAAGVTSSINRVLARWNPRKLIYVEVLPRKTGKFEEIRAVVNSEARKSIRKGDVTVDASSLSTCGECYKPDGLHLTRIGYEKLLCLINGHRDCQ